MSALMVVSTTWLTLFSFQLGKGPWAWNATEWKGFLSFSRQQVEEARTKLEEVDWEGWGAKFSAKTRALWEQVPQLETKLLKTLARLRAPASPPAGVSGEAVPESSPAGAEALPPSQYELGCQSLREGMAHYKKSMRSQAQLKKAKASFLRAQAELTQAFREAQAAGDATQQEEIEGYLQACNTYLQDCSKRETLDLN